MTSGNQSRIYIYIAYDLKSGCMIISSKETRVRVITVLYTMKTPNNGHLNNGPFSENRTRHSVLNPFADGGNLQITDNISATVSVCYSEVSLYFKSQYVHINLIPTTQE